jgi:hypothetical protein
LGSPEVVGVRADKEVGKVTDTQQFYLQLVTLFLAGVVTPLIAIVSAVLSKQSAGKADVASDKAQLAVGKAEVAVGKAQESAQRVVLIEGALYELGKRVDGQLEALLIATGKAQYAEGKEQGRLDEIASRQEITP